MTAIWNHDGTAWRLVAPSGFPAEQVLHDLVEQAPNMLPLSGDPQLVILGKEVFLGGNKADLIAVEPSGRLAIIEIKLKNNAEARRAVIAQILTYAAFLRGLSVEAVERDVLGMHLEKRGYGTLSGAASADDQTGTFEPITFGRELEVSMSEGRFRLVLVLDDAPPELIQLVGYLEAVADKLVIDLVTVAAYEIGGSKVMVPQRIEPDRLASKASVGPPLPAAGQPSASATTRYIAGSEAFESSIALAAEDDRPKLVRLLDWARLLETEGLAMLETTIGTANRWALRPLLRVEKAGLVTIYNDRGASLNFHSTVFARRAPVSLPAVEAAAAPTKVGQGTNTTLITDALLAAVADAYREAAGRSPRVTDELLV